MTTDLQPFLVNYTKAVLTTAATDLGISVQSADTKEIIINKLNRHDDVPEMQTAVYAAAGE